MYKNIYIIFFTALFLDVEIKINGSDHANRPSILYFRGASIGNSGHLKLISQSSRKPWLSQEDTILMLRHQSILSFL